MAEDGDSDIVSKPVEAEENKSLKSRKVIRLYSESGLRLTKDICRRTGYSKREGTVL